MACSAGCALWDNLYRACASPHIRFFSFWQCAACSASFISPSCSALSSSRGTGSFFSAWARALPHPATGAYSLVLLGSLWNTTADISTDVTLVLTRSSLLRSKANQDTPFKISVATSLTETVRVSVQALLSSPKSQRSGSVTSAKCGTHSL